MIGVFPEGRVVAEGPLGELYGGAALLALRAPAPVIPVVIRGSARAWPHGRRCPRPARVRVRIGAAIEPPDERDRQALDRFLVRIRQGLDALASEDEQRWSPS
jgi:1-acyl-sn-glycerol-3-phosphate acyltransferase